MTRKAIYKHRRSGDLFAIETDEKGKVISTSGPLLTKEIAAEADFISWCGRGVVGVLLTITFQLISAAAC